MARRAAPRVLGVAAALAVATLAGCGGHGARRGAQEPAKRPAIAPPPVTDLDRIGARRIHVTGHWLTAGTGAVWLSAPRAIERLDPRTGRRMATVRVPQGPCEAGDVGFGAVWTATCATPGLARIDPATNRVTGHVRLAIPRELGGEASVGAGAGAIWVVVDGRTCTTCRLVGVDPRSLRVTARVPIMQGAAAVRVGAGAVWVTNTDHDVLQQVDPVRGRVVRTVTVGDLPRFLAVDRRGVWTLNQADGTVTRVARRTGRTTSIDAGMHGSGGDLAAGAGWLWARGTERLLTRIDPRGHQVVERYGPASARGAVTVGYGALWVSASDLRIVWRLPLRHVGRESPAT